MDETAIFDPQEGLILAFAKHMAQGIHGFPAACKQVGITEAQGEVLQAHPFYLKHYEAELLRYNSPETVAERMQRLVDESVIFSLPEAVRLIHDPDASDNAKVGMVGNLLKHSSLGTAAKGGGSGGGEMIKIVINAGSQLFQKETESPIIEIKAEKLEATA